MRHLLLAVLLVAMTGCEPDTKQEDQPTTQTETASSEETTAGIDQSSTERTDNTDREPNADAQTGSADRALTFNGHTVWVDGVSFSPDRQRLAIASSDQTVKVWDVARRVKISRRT